jgi:hypothetical protein
MLPVFLQFNCKAILLHIPAYCFLRSTLKLEELRPFEKLKTFIRVDSFEGPNTHHIHLYDNLRPIVRISGFIKDYNRNSQLVGPNNSGIFMECQKCEIPQAG